MTLSSSTLMLSLSQNHTASPSGHCLVCVLLDTVIVEVEKAPRRPDYQLPNGVALLSFGHFRPQLKQNPSGLVPVDFRFTTASRVANSRSQGRSLGWFARKMSNPHPPAQGRWGSLLINPVFQRSAPTNHDVNTVHLGKIHRTPLISYVPSANNAVGVARRQHGFSYVLSR